MTSVSVSTSSGKKKRGIIDMSNHTPSEEIDRVLRQYKKSLANWVSRASNDSPAENQKGRIVQEIDTEASAQLQQLLIRERRDGLKAIVERHHDTQFNTYDFDGIAESVLVKIEELETELKALTSSKEG